MATATVQIDRRVWIEAKKAAAEREITLRKLIEEALKEQAAKNSPSRAPV